jgi:hypothetical protein
MEPVVQTRLELDPNEPCIKYKDKLVSLREYILIVINDEFTKKRRVKY